MAGGLAVTGGYLSLGAGVSAAITAATNATPIVLTTSPALSLLPGDLITVSGVGGNTNANGTWVIAAISGTSVTLYGSVGNSAYTTGGAVAWNTQVEYSGSAHTFTRSSPSYWMSVNGPTTTVYWDATSGFIATTGSPTTSVFVLGADFDAPTGAMLTSASIDFSPFGNGASHGGAPGTMPTAKIVRLDLRSGAGAGLRSNLATATSTYGSAGAYEVYQSLTVTLGSPEPVDRSRFRYFIQFTAEFGANALSGTQVSGASYSGTIRAPSQF